MKKFKLLFKACIFILIPLSSFAQRSKHGALTVVAANTRINEYTSLIANATLGSSTITVANNNLNANGRFTSALQVGDLVMIIQMQGALIKTFNAVAGQDSTYGEILNYNDCGRYEFHQVFALPNATSIVLDCGLLNNYSASGKTQIVRVPRLSALTVNAGASITGDTWNGTIGGIVSAEVNGATVINGSVVATGLGFRAGVAANDGNYGGLRYVDMNVGYPEGGEKGESIAGSQADLAALYNGKHSRGAPANGGGGGNSHNAGGGGGANAGIPATWRGYGIVNPAFNASYNLEFPGRAAIVSSGGGKGGYAYSSAGLNPTTTGPNLGAWGGDGRKNNGGFGGRPLDYSSGRIFLGGGGGAGHVNNIGGAITGGTGGNGGGLIYFITYGNVSGAGAVVTNGNNGVSATGPNPGIFSSSIVGNDSGGGGGGGGTIVFNTTGTVSGIVLTANGGLGGNQIIVKGGLVGTVNEAEGPGGGGGGGYIALSAGAPTQNVLGANSGTTNTQSMPLFPPNGATNGAPGLSNQSITLFTLTANPVTVCVNNAATLTANSNNATASYLWYNALTGPSQLATGAVYTTSVFTTPGTYTFFVGMCPGNYRVPVVVTVTNGPTLTVNSATICSGQSVLLTANGASTYTWSTGPNTSTISVSPAITSVYTVTGSSSGCPSFTTATVTVNTASTIAVSSASVCAGQSATLTAGPATSYTWSNGGNISTNAVTPALTTVYTLTANISGCNVVNTGTVTVNPLPITSANSVTICAGNSATLTANGATTYSWSTTALSNSIVVNPAITTNYTVTGFQNGCSTSTVVSVVISTLGTLPVNSATICAGQNATLTAGAATSYSWSTGSTTNSIVVSPSATTLYSLVANVGGCLFTGNATVSVINSATVVVNQPIICAGQSATLIAAGATTYSWSTGALSNSIVVSPIATTIYTITGNPGGCATVTAATVIVNPTPTVASGNASICAGQSVTLNAVGATTYLWNDGTPTASNVVTPASSSTYTVTGTIGSCTASATAFVLVNALPTIAVTNITICAGQTATIVPAGATQYTFDPGGINLVGTSFTINPAVTNTYAVVGSSNNCTNTSSISITIGANLSIAVANATVCSGNSVVLTATSTASSYTWSTGSNTNSISVSPSVNTTYTVSGSDGVCTGSTTVQVVIGSTPTLSVTATAICPGQTSTLTASGANTYTWLPNGFLTPSITATPLANVVYTLVGNAGSCDGFSVYTLSVTPNPVLTVASQSVCNGGTVTLTANGAASYNWLPSNTTGSTLTVSPVANTVYTVVGSVGNCTAQATASVTLVSGFNLNVGDVNICSGQSATLNASAGNTFTWSTGANTSSIVVSPTISTNYSVTAALGSCINSTLATVYVFSAPSLSVNQAATVLCLGENTTLNASGALTYTWLPGNQNTSLITVTPSVSTIYTVSSSVNNCISSRTLAVFVNTIPSLSVNLNTFEICKGEEVEVSVNGAATYTVSTPQFNTSFPPFRFKPSANTTLTITGANGNCTSTTTAFITVHVVTASFIEETSYANYPAYINFTNTSTPLSTVSWDFGNGVSMGAVQQPRVLFEDPRKYLVSLVAVDAFGCKDTLMKIIEAGCGSGDIYIPNSFTPNNDNINDEFAIVGPAVCISNFSGRIFDRWGETLFTWSDISSKWDGRFKGKEVEQGSYAYQLEYQVPGGKTIVKTGHILVIR